MLSLVHFGGGGFDPYPAFLSLRAPYSEAVLYHGSSEAFQPTLLTRSIQPPIRLAIRFLRCHLRFWLLVI